LFYPCWQKKHSVNLPVLLKYCQIANEIGFYSVGIGFAKQGAVAGLVVVLGGEPMG
jgi:hypothetical protein